MNDPMVMVMVQDMHIDESDRPNEKIKVNHKQANERRQGTPRVSTRE